MTLSFDDKSLFLALKTTFLFKINQEKEQVGFGYTGNVWSLSIVHIYM